MARLTRAEYRSRLAFDASLMRRLSSPHLGAIRAYASAQDLQRGRLATDAEERDGHALVWTVEYRFRMLAARERPLERAVARFDLAAAGDMYPYQPPNVVFEGAAPYCPHVSPATGVVCIGRGWQQADGRMLLPQLVQHVMRLVNFDEPMPKDGNNGDALAYWQSVLRGRPLDPALEYPQLPVDIFMSAPPPPAEGARLVARAAATAAGATATRAVLTPRAAASHALAAAPIPAPPRGRALLTPRAHG